MCLRRCWIPRAFRFSNPGKLASGREGVGDRLRAGQVRQRVKQDSGAKESSGNSLRDDEGREPLQTTREPGGDDERCLRRESELEQREAVLPRRGLEKGRVSANLSLASSNTAAS